MKYICAYLLCKSGGIDAPSAADVTKVLAAAGVATDDAEANAVVSGLEGKDLAELIDSQKDRIFVGGGGGGGAGGGGGGAGAAEEAPQEEKKKEEEEVDFSGGMDMFGGGGEGGGDY